jgi:hypothetical protein
MYSKEFSAQLYHVALLLLVVAVKLTFPTGLNVRHLNVSRQRMRRRWARQPVVNFKSKKIIETIERVRTLKSKLTPDTAVRSTASAGRKEDIQRATQGYHCLLQ